MNPIFIFFLLILGLPTLEIYLLIELGSEIGALLTVFLVVFTAVLGAFLMQRQGIGTMLRVRQAMDRGEVPALEMLEGAVLLVGGLLLLIPGFFTDALGFLCLIPPLRRLLLLGFLRRAQIHGEVVSSVHRSSSSSAPSSPSSSSSGPRVIEGEFHKEND